MDLSQLSAGCSPELQISNGLATRPATPSSQRQRRSRLRRELRQVCMQWQEQWEDQYQDHIEGMTSASVPSHTSILTLGQLFDHLHAERTETMAKITTDRDRYKLRLWREELGSNTPLLGLSVDAISTALRRIGKRTSPSTGNASFALVKTYLNWAAQRGLVADHRHKTVRRLKELPADRRHTDWWTTAEIELAIRCAEKDSHPVTAVLLVASRELPPGLRPEECNHDALAKSQISMPSIPRPASRSRCATSRRMTIGRPRMVRRDPSRSARLSCASCNAYGCQMATCCTLSRTERGGLRGSEGMAWTTATTRDASRRRVRNLVIEAGGKSHHHVWQLRHSFASNLLIAGVSDVKVARWLGHRDTRMLHKHYGHLLSYDADINPLGGGR